MQTHINNYFHENSLKHQRCHHEYSKQKIEHRIIKTALNDTPVLNAPYTVRKKIDYSCSETPETAL